MFENLALKKQIFTAIDAVAKPGCILATNTSTLDIDEIASATTRPESVVGLHFFSPANVMRLVEIVRGTRHRARRSSRRRWRWRSGWARSASSSATVRASSAIA